MIKVQFLSLIFIASTSGLASVATDNNLREQCRKRVAGLHLTLRDKVEIGKRRLKSLEDQNQRISAKIKELKIMHKKLQKSWQNNQLDLVVKENADYTYNRIVQLENFESNNNQNINEIKSSSPQDEKEFNAWLKRLPPAFKLKKYEGENSLGYPYEVIYKTPCPAYMTSCPLNKRDKVSVKTLFEGYEFPIECERYIGQN